MRTKHLLAVRFALSTLLALLGSASVQAAQPLAGHWEGTTTREGKSLRTVLDLSAQGPGWTGTVDNPDAGLYRLPLSNIRLEGSQVRFEIPDRSGPIVVEGTLAEDRITGTFHRGELTAAVDLRRTSPQPVLFVEEEVRFQSGDVTLAGTLIRPEGPGPFPAVVLTHGSGLFTRDLPRYRSWGYLFARHGVAALIYDRRGMGASTGDPHRFIPFPLLAADALAGVRALRSRRDILPGQVGVAGHSQGTWSAPLAASLSRDVAFVIVTSAPGMTAAEQGLFALEGRLRRKSTSDAEIAAALDKERAALPAAGASTGDPQEDARLRDFWHFNPVPVWEKVAVPILALWGEEDPLVPAAKSREILERALARGGNPDVTLRIFPHAAHSFELIRGPEEGWDWDRRVPGIEEAIAVWLSRRLTVRRAS